MDLASIPRKCDRFASIIGLADQVVEALTHDVVFELAGHPRHLYGTTTVCTDVAALMPQAFAAATLSV